MKYYPERIKKLRKKMKISVNKIAYDLGINEGTYYRWERGEHTPNQNDLRVLAEVLGTCVSYISDLHVFKSDAISIEMGITKSLMTENIPSPLRENLIQLDKYYTNIKNENNSIRNDYRRCQRIYEEGRIASYIKDNELRFISCNNSFISLFGYRGKFIGKNNSSILSVEEAKALSVIERKALDTRLPIDGVKIELADKDYLLFVTVLIDKFEDLFVYANLVEIDFYT